MKRIILTIAAYSILSAGGPSYSNTQQIKQLITKLYKEANSDFLYSSDRVDSKEYLLALEKRYMIYYSDHLVAMVLKRAKDPGDDPRVFFSVSDPRFAKEGNSCEYREKIINLIIHEPVFESRIQASIRVDYKTDQTDGELCVTTYYLKATRNGWRIYDQWLGVGYYKNGQKSPDLLSSLEASEKTIK